MNERGRMKMALSREQPDSKKKRLLNHGAGLLLLLGVVLAGCSGRKTETVAMLGSNTVGEELAPCLVAEYKKDHRTSFNLEFKGTSYGLGALMVDKCDIAAASRELTPTEKELARDRAIKFNDYVIGSYSVAVIVNAGNSVSNLTADQVQKLFTGEIENWKEVGGPDMPVHLYIRDPMSGTHLGFQELAMNKKAYASGFKARTNYVEIVQSVAKDPNAIGYASIDVVHKPGVKPVSIGGITPSIEAINKGKYPYARVLRLFTNRQRETPAAHEFIEFVLSPSGQKIIGEMGFVPKP
jgi:phosphate transport system substrate-binding protein